MSCRGGGPQDKLCLPWLQSNGTLASFRRYLANTCWPWFKEATKTLTRRMVGHPNKVCTTWPKWTENSRLLMNAWWRLLPQNYSKPKTMISFLKSPFRFFPEQVCYFGDDDKEPCQIERSMRIFAVLGPLQVLSWAILRAILSVLGRPRVPKTLKNNLFFKVFKKCGFCNLGPLVHHLGPSWSILGLSWATESQQEN